MAKKGRPESVWIAQEALMPPSLIDTQIKVTKETDGNCQKLILLESLDRRTVLRKVENLTFKIMDAACISQFKLNLIL